MKANELMIGDLVEVSFFEGKPKIVKVEEILSDEINPVWVCDGIENYGGIKIKYVNPIPLTSEILEKNGFNEVIDSCKISTYHDRKSSINITMFSPPELTIFTDSKILINGLSVHYIHDLQHALKLCGIEKTIEP